MKLTLIARRSRHFAGTRYLKRGVNEKGRVANDVETEQIVFDDTSMKISSIVQNRGSIPLFWSQEATWLNMKPDIILHKKDQHFHATRLHFDNLQKRYGSPIIILSLTKANEKKPRESVLMAEYETAIAIINKNSPNKSPLEFLHCDIHKHYPRKARDLMALLGKFAANAVDSIGFFYYQLPSTMGPSSLLSPPIANHGLSENVPSKEGFGTNEKGLAKLPMLQNGVFRTNCIDCLDRTNIAQFVFGLTSLGRQLHACGVIDVPIVDLDGPLDKDLMRLYERMGDTLALQYGGSTTHKKVFSERRGQWKAATQSQEIFTTIQRYYNNTYMDAKKQEAINVFLGHFQPQQGMPVLWELDSDQHYNVGSCTHVRANENSRSSIKRSLSDGNILSQSSTHISCCNPGQNECSVLPSYEKTHCLGDTKEISGPLTEMASENNSSNSRQLCKNCRRHYGSEYGFDTSNYSNLSDLDSLFSSSQDSTVEGGTYNRSSSDNLPAENLSSENIIDGLTANSTLTINKGARLRNLNIPNMFSDTFVYWVAHGPTIFG